MSGCVLDASAAMAALVLTQRTPAAFAFFSVGGNFIAPSQFALEVRHALLRLERRGLAAPGEADADLVAMETKISFDTPQTREQLAAIFSIARSEQLSIYDAAYLELALRHGAPLASRDGSLLAAAKRRGVEVVDLR